MRGMNSWKDLQGRSADIFMLNSMLEQMRCR
ncbi:unnamed protein product, partial [marine sediment metagenome]